MWSQEGSKSKFVIYFDGDANVETGNAEKAKVCLVTSLGMIISDLERMKTEVAAKSEKNWVQNTPEVTTPADKVTTDVKRTDPVVVEKKAEISIEDAIATISTHLSSTKSGNNDVVLALLAALTK